MIHIQVTNRWERLETRQLPNPVSTVLLGPTQSMSFVVLCPATDRPWFVEVYYKDYLPGGPPRSRTLFERFAGQLTQWLPFARKSTPASYFTRSEIMAPSASP